MDTIVEMARSLYLRVVILWVDYPLIKIKFDILPYTLPPICVLLPFSLSSNACTCSIDPAALTNKRTVNSIHTILAKLTYDLSPTTLPPSLLVPHQTQTEGMLDWYPSNNKNSSNTYKFAHYTHATSGVNDREGDLHSVESNWTSTIMPSLSTAICTKQ